MKAIFIRVVFALCLLFSLSLDATARELSIDEGPTADEPLNVLTYNIFMRPTSVPTFNDNQDERAALIPGQVGGYDVIVFQEAFSDSHREQILSSLAAEYPYQTRILGKDRGLEQDGGVVIVSMWPIEREFQMLFEDVCEGDLDDCFADKGVLYARLDWNGKPIHIFGTHTQAGDTEERRETRETQLILIKSLIKEMTIPADQPVLIAGDMNVDLYNDDEYTTMLDRLSAAHPLPQSGDPLDRGYTSDPLTNEYVDENNPRKYLDYFLYSIDHLRPDQSSNDVRILKVDGRDLSDHYPVEGSFTFSGIGTTPIGSFPFAVFFEGNNAEQDYVCNVSMAREKALDLTNHRECVNDEARSLILYDVPAGAVLRLYDNSEGNREDDWVEILVKRPISEKLIRTFEQSFEDDDVRMTYFRNNGLDGKVSRLEVGRCSDDCGVPVSILSPRDGTTVPAGGTEIVRVWARFGATDVQLYVDGVSQPSESYDGQSTWSFRWDIPPDPDRVYQLRASAMVDGSREEDVVTVTAKIVTEVEFEQPRDGATVTVNQQVAVVVQAPQETGSVDLQFTPGDGLPVVSMQQNLITGRWEYLWTPASEGGYILRAVAYDSNNVFLDDKTIQVTAQREDVGGDGPQVSFANLSQNQVIRDRPYSVRVTATDPQGVDSVYVDFQGPESGSLEGPVSCGSGCSEFEWNPGVNGRYTLFATAVDRAGNFGQATVDVEVDIEGLPARDDTIVINRHGFIRKVTGQRQRGSLAGGVNYDTGIETAGYVCGVVGFAAHKGDINEKNDYSDIIKVYVEPRGGTWRFRADFKTYTGSSKLSELWETWDANILCLSTQLASADGPQLGKPVFRATYPNLGDNVGGTEDVSTEIDFNAYACGIVGFKAKKGDIQEHKTGNIIQTYLFRKNSTWHMRADFRSHDTGKNSSHENWDLDLLCFSTDIASLDTPVPGRSYFFREYFDLGDNLGVEREFDTEFSVEDYVCGVVGFAALDGDIDEHGSDGRDLIATYLYAKNGSWHVRADFRTHNNDETWNVNILCAQREGATPNVRPNVSREEFGLEHCMGKNMRCQVLRNELVDLTGVLSVSGGGYSGNPSQTGYRCGATDAVEVYINDRDPGTGKPLWSWPNACLRHGQSITLNAANTYDLRGVSVVGGTTRAFYLQQGAALAPVMRGAEPKLFPNPYGPGIALTWEPTVSLSARHYEIQFSEDGGQTWNVYTRSRDISHGGWINHHGNLACGDGFTRCLKSSRRYTYRVRVLDSARNPISGWSNLVSATSMDWADLPPPNRAPTLAAPSYVGVYWKDTVSFTVTAADLDGDQVQILVDGLPNRATLSPTSGAGSVTATFFWNPGASDLGERQITFTAKDHNGATSTKVTTINVCDGSPDCLF